MSATAPNPESSLVSEVDQISSAAADYFTQAENALIDHPREDQWSRFAKDHYWASLPANLQELALELRDRVVNLIGQIAHLTKSGLLTSEADQQDLKEAAKTMRSALLLREFRSWSGDVVHDEGTVFGYNPPSQSDDRPFPPEEAKRRFADSVEVVRQILNLVAAGRSLSLPTLGASGARAIDRTRRSS